MAKDKHGVEVVEGDHVTVTFRVADVIQGADGALVLVPRDAPRGGMPVTLDAAFVERLAAPPTATARASGDESPPPD